MDGKEIIAMVAGVSAVVFVIVVSVVLALAPSTGMTRISPISPGEGDDLVGYCNSSNEDGDVGVGYYYRWYRDGELFMEGREGFNSTCYQETANESTVCGGLDSGSYEFGGSWNSNSYKILDGNWSTYGNTPFDLGWINITYGKPGGNLLNSLWEVKYTPSVNVSIPQTCFDYDENYLYLKLSYYPPGLNLSCYSKGGTQRIGDYFSMFGDIHEEAMIWEIIDNNQYRSGVEANVSIIGSENTSGGETWIFSCLANNGSSNASAWINDSVAITNPPSLTSSPSSGSSSSSYTLSEISGDEEQTVNMDSRDKAKVEHDGEKYYIETDKVRKEYVELKVDSSNENIVLNVGESVNLDLDGDGTYDITASLGSIDNGDAKIIFSEYEEVISVEAEPFEEEYVESVVETEESSENKNIQEVMMGGRDYLPVFLLGIGLFAVIGIFSLYYFYNKKT